LGEALKSRSLQKKLADFGDVLKKPAIFSFLLSLSGLALAAKSFDEKPYTLSTNLSDAPMYTLVGITDWGADILRVYGITTIVMVFVFMTVALPTLYVLWKFKAKGNETELPKQFTGNHVLELIWTIVPVGLLFIIAIPTWEVIFKQSARAGDPNNFHVKVIGHQWWWEFQYPDLGITTANELHLPENTPIEFSITSDDVIHSFYVPRFGGKIDAIPGVINHIYVTTPASVNPAMPGGDFYQGHCLELCGQSHALMRFEAYVHTKQGFDTWAKNAMNPPQVLSAQEKRGEAVFAQCQACHSISGTDSAKIPGKKLGPDLTNFGNRRYLGAMTRENNMDNLRLWIKNSASIKPGSRMTGFEGILSDQQIDDVSTYIRISTAKKL
jgi:cytochrome c oxidase subunit 2